MGILLGVAIVLAVVGVLKYQSWVDARRERYEGEARIATTIARLEDERRRNAAPANTIAPKEEDEEDDSVDPEDPYGIQDAVLNYESSVNRALDPDETSVELPVPEDDGGGTYPWEVHSVRRASQTGHYLITLSNDEELWGNPMLHSDDEGIWYCEDGTPYDDAYTGLELSDLKAAVVRYEVELAREYVARPRPLKGW